MIDYRIKAKRGSSEKIGELMSMLEHTRAVTLEELKGLRQEDLDYLADEGANTIGALLLHIASIEFVHQVISFENRDLNKAEFQKWKTALELGEPARSTIRDYPLEYYLNELAQVRQQTIIQLEKYDDDWLMEEEQWENGVPNNNYYLWFHVLEDEINHRGQIRSIKRLLSKR
ncbi:DinB family protein [Halobacillus rhizosphaerae]|uniref:DinB family protein n=1 Tax=Halobacillus rhizosphaerae TaxID=3064889 RepID=UPI00398A5F95